MPGPESETKMQTYSSAAASTKRFLSAAPSTRWVPNVSVPDPHIASRALTLRFSSAWAEPHRIGAHRRRFRVEIERDGHRARENSFEQQRVMLEKVVRVERSEERRVGK